MKTTSIMLQTLCVPCSCHCRYCLLGWDGHLPGLDYGRSQDFARRFHQWLRENRPGLPFHFSFGFSMEHPRLLDAIDFLREIGSVGARYLHFDGMAFRESSALSALLQQLKARGVETLNFTFYGVSQAHDQFAGRSGDYAYLLQAMRLARETGLQVTAGIPLTQENAGQADALCGILEKTGAESIRLFVPHAEGRGILLDGIRFSLADHHRLSPASRQRFNRAVYKTEAEWLAEGLLKPPQSRTLLISLTPENIDAFEAMGFEALIRYVESLDDAYYDALPSPQELARLYGDRDHFAFYHQRDLLWHYQQRYIAAHRLTLHDVTNERLCGSRRF